ncbi:MAG: hypothetical protein AB7F50_07200 [Fimbriimonadaceae bacterium]
MKRTLLTLAASALAGAAVAQPIGTTEIIAESYLNSPLSYRVADAQRAPNGDYVFLLDVTDTSTDMVVTRTTANGAVIWTRAFPRPGAPGGQFCHMLTIAQDGKIYAVSSIDGTNDARDFYFVELNSLGFKLNERVVDHFSNDYQVGDFQASPDGAVYFCAGGLSSAQPLLVRMNADLTTDWAYSMGNSAGVATQRAGELDTATDGSVVASATYDSVGDTDCQFVRLTAAGTFVYEKLLGDSANNDAVPKVMQGSDDYTYFTYTRSHLTASEETRLSRYDAAGVFQWNKQDPGFAESAFAETPHGTFVFTEVQNAAPFSLKVFEFDGSGNVLWSKTSTRPNMDSHSLGNLRVDDDGYISISTFGAFTGKVGGDMLLAAFSRSGVPLYEWAYDTGAGFYDVPAGLVNAALGEVVFTGATSVSGAYDTQTFQIRPVLLVQPNSYNLRLGRRDAGNLNSTFADDNDVLRICKFIVPNQSAAPINIEFDSTVPADYPIRTVEFQTIVKANTVGLQQDVQLWNFLSNSWDQSALTSITLSEQKTSTPGLPDPNVEGITRNVRSRVRVRQIGPVTLSIWCVELDLAGWRITP